MSEIVIHTLRRFKEVLDSLECECHDGFTCTIHNDKRLVESALKIMEKEDSKSKLLIHYCVKHSERCECSLYIYKIDYFL